MLEFLYVPMNMAKLYHGISVINFNSLMGGINVLFIKLNDAMIYFKSKPLPLSSLPAAVGSNSESSTSAAPWTDSCTGSGKT